MRYVVLGLVFCLVAVSSAFAAASGATLTLKDDRISVERNGKSTLLPQDMFPAQPIEGTTLRFAGVGEDDGKKYGIAAGLYIFESQGPAAAFAPTEFAEYCSEVRLSPAGDVLAMDSGTWLIRSWFFFSFPGMKPMGEVVYYQSEGKPALVWTGTKGALVSSMQTDDQGRTCEYDPCGPVSVDYYDFAAQRDTRLLSGTDTCDYTLTGITEDGLAATALELCLQSADAWKTLPENAPTKPVTATVP